MFMTTENNSVTCLLGAMDLLWFHQTILLPKITSTISESPDSCLSENTSVMSVIPEQEISPVVSFISDPHDQDDTTSSDKSDLDKEEERPTRLSFGSNKTRFSSSSPTSAKTESRKVKRYSSRRLKKTTSCKSLAELELEEVKGFMDLGFNFKKENLSQQVISLIPGLQRLDGCDKSDFNDDYNDIDDDDDDDFEDLEEEKKEGIMRPYLSEAWLVQRHDSQTHQLFKLRMLQSVSTSADMKKHLKFWARSVASTIYQKTL